MQNKITHWNLVWKLLSNPLHFMLALSYKNDTETQLTCHCSDASSL